MNVREVTRFQDLWNFFLQPAFEVPIDSRCRTARAEVRPGGHVSTVQVAAEAVELKIEHCVVKEG